METADILTKIKSLSRSRRSCTYYHVDLHVHSPASSDYSGDPGISPHEFVSAYVERGLDLISITDHNTGAYIDGAIAARDQIAKEVGKNITILPGVELYVSPGVHLLAILAGGGSAAVSDLLSRLGLRTAEYALSDIWTFPRKQDSELEAQYPRAVLVLQRRFAIKGS